MGNKDKVTTGEERVRVTFNVSNNNKVNELKVKSDRINDRTAPNNVLEATDRRTTNPKEREILHKYLLPQNG